MATNADRRGDTDRGPEAQDDLRAVVFVEGASDRAALLALAARLQRDLDAEGVAIVPMDGFTGIGRFLSTFGPAGRNLVLAGLCDAGEAGYVRRRLTAAGVSSEGLLVCDADLEEELIRALGVAAVERVLEGRGELGSFRLFCLQPAQRGRPVEARLHRFVGTRSGRKLSMAAAFVDALPIGQVPRPLAGVLALVGLREFPTESSSALPRERWPLECRNKLPR